MAKEEQLSNEIRETLVDHVINHGLILRERDCSLSQCQISFLQFSFSVYFFVSIFLFTLM